MHWRKLVKRDVVMADRHCVGSIGIITKCRESTARRSCMCLCNGEQESRGNN